jgi:hypothetical protein|tara:strand:- start:280 stop:444 length:165 start_codon:yes stop_codon:yes gene_type:complete
MSFTIAQTEIFFFLDWERRLIKRVVFPEPRKPLSTTTETFPVIFVGFCFEFLMT